MPGNRALVRHVREIDLRQELQIFGREMRRARASRRGVVDLARALSRVGDQLLDVLHRQRRMRDENVRAIDHHAHRREVAFGVERQVLVRVRQDRVADRDREQRVSVRRGFRDDVTAHRAARSRAVLDDAGLAERVLEALRHHARARIDAAADGGRRDDADRFRGKGLCGRRRRQA